MGSSVIGQWHNSNWAEKGSLDLETQRASEMIQVEAGVGGGWKIGSYWGVERNIPASSSYRIQSKPTWLKLYKIERGEFACLREPVLLSSCYLIIRVIIIGMK